MFLNRRSRTTTTTENKERKQRPEEHSIPKHQGKYIKFAQPNKKTHVLSDKSLFLSKEEQEDMLKPGQIRLDALFLSANVAKGFDDVKKICFPNRCIAKCEDLSFLQFLNRVELNNNVIETLNFLKDNTDITYINMSYNLIRDIQPIKDLKQLQVLNLSHNQIESVASEPFTYNCSTLKALILNNNRIKSLPNIKFTELNTLVVSHNELTNIDMIAKCENLRKISAANNQIRQLPDGIKFCLSLEELRLGHNKLTSLPNSISFNVNLKILNLSHNLISSFDEIKKLSMCKKMKDLALNDNPISKNENYREHILQILPQLEVLDGEPIKEKQKKKVKREELDREDKKGSTIIKKNGKDISPKKQKFDNKNRELSRNDKRQKLSKKDDENNSIHEGENTIPKEKDNEKSNGTHVVKDTHVVVERLIDEEKEKKLLEKLQRERERIAQEMELVNVKELNEQKRNLREMNGGYAETDEKFSGVSKVSMAKRKKSSKNQTDILKFLTLDTNDEHTSGWD
jgi:Leucine-rich repeat (LRR) protein